ncbi:MAG: dihydrofolate reductase [Chloroflexi bacterium]|nr:MAG: dihydrofolate reductase [Chloroflexota bacterium]
MAKVLWHVTMSLDGYIAGPGNSMDWMLGYMDENAEVNALLKNIGAVLSGRNTYDVGAVQERREFRGPYGGAWSGPVYVLTHKPPEDPKVTFLSGDIRAAVERAGRAAGDRYLVVFGADVARQCIEANLLDDVVIHVVPVLLGDGVRLFSKPGGDPIHLELAGAVRAGQVANLRLAVVG